MSDIVSMVKHSMIGGSEHHPSSSNPNANHTPSRQGSYDRHLPFSRHNQSSPRKRGKNQQTSGVGTVSPDKDSGSQKSHDDHHGHPTGDDGTEGRNGVHSPRQILEPILIEIREIKLFTEELKSSLDVVQRQIQQEYSYFHQALNTEKYKYQKLEDQMNDLTELHQAEMNNLKQEITSMQDKLEYQNQDRLADIHDAVENAQTRISKIEYSQQNSVALMDGYLQSTPSRLVLKLFSAVIIFLQCWLVVISTFAQSLKPFFRTRVRMVITIAAASVVTLTYHSVSTFVQKRLKT